MPPEKTEGITQERLDRLWEHLLKLEKLTGKALRLTPRGDSGVCPISNFAPFRDTQRRFLLGTSEGGLVVYEQGDYLSNHEMNYQVYNIDDSRWWKSLTRAQRSKATAWIKTKLKERNVN